MRWPDFGSRKPVIEAPSQQEIEARAMERAHSELMSRAMLAVVDHNGKRLNERRWREHYAFVEFLL